MRKIIMTLGFAVALVAYVVGVYGLVSTPDAHAVPTPLRLVAYGCVAMMGTAVALIMVFAHGSSAGDFD